MRGLIGRRAKDWKRMMQQNNQTTLGRSTVCMYICVYKMLGPFTVCYMQSALVVTLYVCMYVCIWNVCGFYCCIREASHSPRDFLHTGADPWAMCMLVSIQHHCVFLFGGGERARRGFFWQFFAIFTKHGGFDLGGGETTTRSTHISYAKYIRFAFPHSLTPWPEVNVIVYWPHQLRWVHVLRVHATHARGLGCGEHTWTWDRLRAIRSNRWSWTEHAKHQSVGSHARTNVQVSLRRYRRKLFERKDVASNVDGNTATVNLSYLAARVGRPKCSNFCQGISHHEIFMLEKLDQVLSKIFWVRGKGFRAKNSVYRLFWPCLLNWLLTPFTAMKFGPKFFWKWSFFDQNQPLKSVEPFERNLRALFISWHNARTNSPLFPILEMLLTSSDCFHVISDRMDSFFRDLHAFRHWPPPEICQVE